MLSIINLHSFFIFLTVKSKCYIIQNRLIIYIFTEMLDMAGKHTAQHVSQHSAPRQSSRPARRSEVYDEEEEYVPRRSR